MRTPVDAEVQPAIPFTQVDVSSYLRNRIAFHKFVDRTSGSEHAAVIVKELETVYEHLFKHVPDTSEEDKVLGG